jgi:hypothetical protein
VVRRQQRLLLSLLDGWWAHVLSHADVVSEGAVRAEPGGEVFYGTVSIRCRLDPLPTSLATFAPPELARLVLADPHARVRIVRLVHREVASRAPSPLGVVRLQLESSACSRLELVAGAAAGPAAPELELRADVEVAAIGPATRRRRAAR